MSAATVETEAAAWLEVALRYAAMGWRLVPLHAREKRPRLDAWQRMATTDAEIIERWAEQWPDSNLGVVLGPNSGVIDIECDSEAEEEILRLLAGEGGIPVTPTYQSKRGKHRLFKWSDALPCTEKGIFYIGKLGFRTGNGAKGAQSALPPSIHESGVAYKWLVSPEDCDPAEIPPEMMARISIAAVEGIDALKQPARKSSSASAESRAWNYVDKIPRSVSGDHGHDQLFETACRLIVGFGLQANAARELLDRWNAGCQPPWSDKEIDHKIDQAEKKAQEQPGRVGELLKASSQASGNSQEFKRPMIVVGPDEHRVAALAAYIHAKQPLIFQRYGQLVRLIKKADAPPGMKFAEGESLKISPLLYATLREILADAAVFMKANAKDELVAARVPRDCVEAILQRKEWPGIPTLTGIALGPVLRPDGSVLASPGYDGSTGLFVDDHGLKITTPERPTQDDACRAAQLLSDLLFDFPFEKPHHKSAALAAVLTHLGRWVVQDNAPLFAIDANQSGTGKGLLVDVIVGLMLGVFKMARMPMPGTDDEWRKQITSAVIAGTNLMLIDNQEGPFGNPILDAALTSRQWQDRVLGKSELVSMLLDILWFITGNNLQIIGDTVRRVCHIRMISPCENPEDRSGFKFPNIRDHVRENRSELVSAAFTVLRGFIVAGQPDQKLRPWGSFERWSNLVRGALVWAGQPDPAEGRVELKNRNSEAQAVRVLFDEWGKADPEGRGITARELLQRLNRSEPLAEAVESLCRRREDKALTSHQVGMLLRRLQNRVVGGRSLISQDKHDNTVRWSIHQQGG